MISQPWSQEKCVNHFQIQVWELMIVNLLNTKNFISHVVVSFIIFSVSCSPTLLLIALSSAGYGLSFSFLRLYHRLPAVTYPLLPTDLILFVSWSEIQLIKLSLYLKPVISILNLKGVQNSFSPLLTVLEALVKDVIYLCQFFFHIYLN